MTAAKDDPDLRGLSEAAAEAERSKKAFVSTLAVLQYRLKPGTLVSNAWDGVRDKSGEVADTTIQAVKGRPVTAGGVVAALVIFLARDPLKRAASAFLRRNDDVPEGTIDAHLDHDEDFDLTAPVVAKASNEGVNA